ncbi:MAG: energy-coupling factor transporter ATPase [Faecousia sp.]
MPILEVKDLSHIYSVGTPFQHAAIEHMNFTLERGEFVGIIGHTGSGKSTLMQHLNGLLKPTSGQVLFEGRDIWEEESFTRSIRFKVGLVFQYPEYQLFEETVYKDIAFGPSNMKLPAREIDRRVREAARFVGVPEEALEKSPFELSGGQKRRVAIAGVIAMEPDVLILDEPTAGLDPEGRESILSNIQAYRSAKNATILMVSHAMEDVARLADRLLVLDRGAIRMDAEPRAVFQRAWELREIGLSIPQVTQVFLRLREMGVPVDSGVYTIDQAVAELKRLKRGAR